MALGELHEEGKFLGFKRQVECVQHGDEEAIEEIVVSMYQSRKINEISKEMHEYLCYLLAERTVPN